MPDCLDSNILQLLRLLKLFLKKVAKKGKKGTTWPRPIVNWQAIRIFGEALDANGLRSVIAVDIRTPAKMVLFAPYRLDRSPEMNCVQTYP